MRRNEQDGVTMNGMKGRVLVVDDDTALAEMLGIVLRSEGFEPVFCADGDRALGGVPRGQARPGAARPDAAGPGRHRRVPADPRRVRRADRHAHGQDRHHRRRRRARVRRRRLRREAVQAQGADRPGPRPAAPHRRDRARSSSQIGDLVIDVAGHSVRRDGEAIVADAARVRPARRAGPQALAGLHPRGAARAGVGLPARRPTPASSTSTCSGCAPRSSATPSTPRSS